MSNALIAAFFLNSFFHCLLKFDGRKMQTPDGEQWKRMKRQIKDRFITGRKNASKYECS